ncbi:MAG TPA: helix-turn-helix transcriptional regulator [Thermoanaerobaculia bacterium]|nr:helix-turn-helix transcriptional regulator [Thermoanaerobaculia bacterium]
MKLGDVLRKEREKKKLTTDRVAEALGIPAERYAEMEAGASPAEVWGPRLGKAAIALETPTSRLLAESGRAADCRPGQAGALIRGHRERRGKSPEEMAEALGVTPEEYRAVEEGTSPLEEQGPLLLGFAELIEQPVFNLFYPCGLPFDTLDDYP